MANSNTSRSLDAMRALRFECQVVEQWIQACKIRRDLFGCIDILAMGNGMLVGVQACSRVDHNKRLEKALAEPRLAIWLQIPGHSFEVHSWAKQGARGKAKRWNVRIQPVELYGGECIAGEAYTPGENGIPALPSISKFKRERAQERANIAAGLEVDMFADSED